MGAITIKSNKYTSPIDTKTAAPQYLGIEFLRDLPLEAKKPYFLSNLTSWANLVIRGTMNNVEQIERINSPLVSLKYCDIAIPIVIPSQNIMFQKLSLFRRALVQFIVTYIFKTHKDIVPLIKSGLKKIRSTCAVLAFLFLSSVTNAEELKPIIDNLENRYNIPQGLLHSIAVVESGISPYVINVGGRAIHSNSKAAALENIKFYITLGYTNIDIGVMQINYRWHSKNFANVSEMLNPVNNIEYAAKLLTNLYQRYGSWHKAVRLYHSATPKHHMRYSRKIIVAWLNS